MKRTDPREPTKEERRIHELSHLPFRNWCRHCVRGKGKEESCKKQPERDEGLEEVHLDFMFMGEEKDNGGTLTFLVAKERKTRMLLATVTPRKSTGDWLAKRLLAWLREIGCEMSRIIIKTDNEPAIVTVVDNLARHRAAKGAQPMIVENSPVYSSKSNGCVERGIQTVQGMIRTLRSALEARWCVKLPTDHAVWSWIAEYAAHLVNRGEVGHDGKTPYERLKGKPGRTQGMEFGEGVLWKRKAEGGPLGKLTCLWDDGVFLGVKPTTGEIIVGDERGIWRTRTVRRKPENERWKKENIKKVAGVPWKLNPEDMKVDGEDLKMNVTIMDERYREKVARDGADAAPKSAPITKEDLYNYGFTKGCQGCVAVLRGTARQTHTHTHQVVEEGSKKT